MSVCETKSATQFEVANELKNAKEELEVLKAQNAHLKSTVKELRLENNLLKSLETTPEQATSQEESVEE